MTRVSVYPGTFDPITFGHLDIVRRALHITDRLVVAVAESPQKVPLFSLEERVSLVQSEIHRAFSPHETARVEVQPFGGLLVDFVRTLGAPFVIRGLRVVSDFEYEFQMVGMNARLAPDIETVFLMASEGVQFITSRFIKEVSRLGGNVTPFVSEDIAARLQQKLRGG